MFSRSTYIGVIKSALVKIVLMVILRILGRISHVFTAPLLVSYYWETPASRLFSLLRVYVANFVEKRCSACDRRTPSTHQKSLVDGVIRQTRVLRAGVRVVARPRRPAPALALALAPSAPLRAPAIPCSEAAHHPGARPRGCAAALQRRNGGRDRRRCAIGGCARAVQPCGGARARGGGERAPRSQWARPPWRSQLFALCPGRSDERPPPPI